MSAETNRPKIIRLVIVAQASYFIGLLISVAITRGGFTDNHGLSFYGEHLRTLLPYGLGTVACSSFLVWAAALVPQEQRTFRLLRTILYVMAALLLLLLLTPDTVGEFMNLSHEVVAFVLFSGELGLAGWITFHWRQDAFIRLLCIIQLGAGLAAMLSEFNVIWYLSASSLVFQLCFSLVVIRALDRLLAAQPEKTEQ